MVCLFQEQERFSGIVQASLQRHDRGRALLQHSYTVRSCVSAAVAVQRCFRVWRDKVRHRPQIMEEQRKIKQRQHTAAATIQGQWRHFRGMQKIKEARHLLSELRSEALLRGTAADMDVVRYQRPTITRSMLLHNSTDWAVVIN